MKVFFGIAGAVALLACSPSDTASSASAIVGGSVDTTTTGVVMVYIRAQDNSGWVDCSGTVISPHVVLTAAHCLDVSLLGLGTNPIFQIFTGQDFYASRPLSDFYDAAATIADPLFSNKTAASAHDVGVVVTQQALPMQPVAFVRTPLDASIVGQSVRLVGYGMTDLADASSDGTRSSGTTTIASIDALQLHTADHLPSGCEGDSGDPMLMSVGAVETVVGVVSGGPANCDGISIGSRVDIEGSFLDPIIDANDPGFLPPAVDDAGADAGDVEISPSPSPGSGCALGPAHDGSSRADWWMTVAAVYAIARFGGRARSRRVMQSQQTNS